MTSIITISADKEQRKFIKEAIENVDLKVAYECKSIKEGLEKYRTDNLPIAVVDLFLPDSSGIEATKHLKQMNENVIVILLSRMRNRALVEKAFRFGADDILIYPITAETLRETILHRVRNARVSEVVVNGAN